jgi:hypothetical protein
MYKQSCFHHAILTKYNFSEDKDVGFVSFGERFTALQLSGKQPTAYAATRKGTTS